MTDQKTQFYFEIKDLSVGFRTFEGIKPVLNIEGLRINRGETYGLVGESGAGKTVLALTILGLLPKPAGMILNGSILFDGVDLLKQSEKQMAEIYRGKRLAMIFQDPMSTLNPVFTVGQQIERVITRQEGLKGKACLKRSLELLDMVKLPDTMNLIDKYPHELSGGQRQRIIIAIALSCGAEFLIADEPTRNLDVTIQAGILKLIDELQRDFKMSVLFIGNNVSLVNIFCRNAGILYRGKLVEEGLSNCVVQNPLHPYTQTLISAIPRSKSEKLKFSKTIIKPEAENGCPYFSRCTIGKENCSTHVPMLREFRTESSAESLNDIQNPVQKAACFYAGGTI